MQNLNKMSFLLDESRAPKYHVSPKLNRIISPKTYFMLENKTIRMSMTYILNYFQIKKPVITTGFIQLCQNLNQPNYLSNF
jgi:hypothetical protein